MDKGILLIDKPSGVTSHDVVDLVRRKLGVKKVGHAGTLDPLATGLLIILVGREYTKKQAEFMAGDKEYLVTGKLGMTTDTYDVEGNITSEAAWEQTSQVTKLKVKKLLGSFTGIIKQQVPAFSAVKIKGKKLYELAREARKVKVQVKVKDLPIREVEIKELELVDFTADPVKQLAEFSLRVICSKGTYIRSLIHDFGQELGVGATVTALRRLKSGGFNVEEAVKLSSFNSQLSLNFQLLIL